MAASSPSKVALVALGVLGVVILATGVFMLGGDLYLIALGGSW